MYMFAISCRMRCGDVWPRMAKTRTASCNVSHNYSTRTVSSARETSRAHESGTTNFTEEGHCLLSDECGAAVRSVPSNTSSLVAPLATSWGFYFHSRHTRYPHHAVHPTRMPAPAIGYRVPTRGPGLLWGSSQASPRSRSATVWSSGTVEYSWPMWPASQHVMPHPTQYSYSRSFNCTV